jgi:hypothetical protein
MRLVQVDSLTQSLDDRLGPAVTMATTEHFNLQTARSATISEANGALRPPAPCGRRV